jgi:hypothetical protein
LGEIAIEAGLVNKAGAARAGKMAEERRLPLVVVLIREVGVDEVALVGALRKQTRVPLLDPADVQIDPEALRQLPRDVCARLRVLPIGVAIEGKTRVLRVAMADPTDTSAVAEMEQLTRAEISPGAASGSTAGSSFGSRVDQVAVALDVSDSEVSVTAQIPVASLRPPVADDLESRLSALIAVLVGKGLVTEAELAESLRKLKNPAGA